MKFTRMRAAQTIAGAAASPWLFAKAAAQATTIRVAMPPIEPACLVYYAKENGYFDKAGLDVDITQNPSTPAIVSATAAGTYDIAYATISTLAVAHVKGLPFVIIAADGGIIPGRMAGAIMVPLNSPIKTAKDLEGKTFGAAGLNTIAEYAPRAWIDKHGGDSTTVKFIEIPFPEAPGALATGRIDATYLVEPFITIVTKRNIGKILATGDDAIAPRFLATVWYTTSQYAKAHPDNVTRFASAISEAARWANANPSSVVPLLSKYLKADPAIVAAAARPYYFERLVTAEMQPWINVTAKYAKFTVFPASELVYTAGR
ncbi:MAG TPA: ABC transporter substrate-binding protein [Candidatus Binatia bacterium]|nr:ABC transporter substrate-binding protein [Candidatus Binatia bacterium]